MRNPNEILEILYFLPERDSQVIIKEDKSLCKHLLRNF
jgi:hypothetical protein